MQRLGGDKPSNPATADQAVNAHESNTSQDKQESQTVTEDKSSAPLPTRTIGVGHGAVMPPWQPGLGCMLDEKSPKKLRDVSEERAKRIIKNIEDEQAQGLKLGLRLEKTWEKADKRYGGWDMFSDQDQDIKVSFLLVMYQVVYVTLFVI